MKGDEQGEMRKRMVLVALIYSMFSAVCIGYGTKSMLEQKKEEEKVTIAEYMDEWKRTHPTVQSNEVETVAAVEDIQYGDPAGLDFTDEESQMLMKLAMAEAEDQGVIGKAIVMNVVKNRVESDQFPNSIEEVIYQPKQFSPIEDGRYDAAVPDAECYEALEWVLNYWDGSAGALYFEAYYNENSWHRDNLTMLFQYDDLIFYK